jgi:ABC-type nickel/cobalt efflux system permease component RcnA
MIIVPHGAPEGYEWFVTLVVLVCLYFAVRNLMRARRWSRARCAIIRPTQRHPALLRAKPASSIWPSTSRRYADRFQYTLSYHSRAMKWACSAKLSGSAEPSTPLGEFDHRHEAVAACEQHHRATDKHRELVLDQLKCRPSE